jgi:hypothetical protein
VNKKEHLEKGLEEEEEEKTCFTYVGKFFLHLIVSSCLDEDKTVR